MDTLLKNVKNLFYSQGPSQKDIRKLQETPLYTLCYSTTVTFDACQKISEATLRSKVSKFIKEQKPKTK